MRMAMLPDDVLSIRIRANLAVHIANMPHDLTQKEADKIIRVICSFVISTEDNEKALWFKEGD